MRRHAGAGLVALAILASGAIRLRLLDLPLERDEGGYATVAQLLLAGVAPYADAYEMRMPGVFLAYALFLGAFGESAEAIRIGLLLSNAASAVLLYLLGRRIADETTGTCAAVLFSATSLAAGVLGLAANTEHFVLLPAIAGLLLLAAPVATGRALGAGLLLGLAFLTKQTAAPLVACGVALAWLGARGRGASARAALACAAGACLPVLGAALALALAGSFEAFWFWTVAYPLTYAAAPPPGAVAAALREGLPRVLATTAPLWLLAGAGGVAGLRTPRLRPAARFALLWLACAIAAVAAGQRFRPQHFLLLLPPGALLAGLATGALAALPGLRGFALRAAQVGIVGVAVAAALWGDREILFEMNGRAASRALHGANPFPEAREIALWLRERASPGERLAVLGSEPEIYFYSRLRPAIPYLHAYEMVQPHPYAIRMQQEVIARLDAEPPRFVVFVNMGISWQAAPGAENRLLDWVRERMPQRYVQVGQVNLLDAQHSEYFWGDTASTAPRSPRGWIAVWELQAKRAASRRRAE